MQDVECGTVHITNFYVICGPTTINGRTQREKLLGHSAGALWRFGSLELITDW